jgi:DNA-damage-inducible protein J
MSKTAMIRARTELKLKSRVEKIFETLGLTASQAINLFYHRVELEKGLPFDMKIPNPKTLNAMADVDKKKNLHSYDHVEGMLRSLKK